MLKPASPHFHTVTLSRYFNADRSSLPGRPLVPGDADWTLTDAFESCVFRGIPFDLSRKDAKNVILLNRDDRVTIETGPLLATYVLFLHAVEDRLAEPKDAWGTTGSTRGGPAEGNDIGGVVATYAMEFENGRIADVPIERRIAIQQRHVTWGASAFGAVPAHGPSVWNSATDEYLLDRKAEIEYGRSENRVRSGRDSVTEHLWIYAMPNPEPETAIRAIHLKAGDERAAIYAITSCNLTDHPLRAGPRKKLVLALPEGVQLNEIGELDASDRDATLAIDLGSVISARAKLDYERNRWLGTEHDVQPAVSNSQVVVEYTSHPRATLHLAGRGAEYSASLAGDPDSSLAITPIAEAARPVRIVVRDTASGQPVPARLHLHGTAGEYLPPRGYHRKVNTNWFEDNYGEFANLQNQYCYMPGECVADLPLGEVFVEISRGFECGPIRMSFNVDNETEVIEFALEKQLDWRERGWVSADTHVHFLSPQTALLEGQAEGVNVVNLLASQWGEMFSNVSDFDGRTVHGAKDFGGDGEFLVRVGTENRMQVMGHISLLGYSGEMIHPLGSGGPSESALGDPLDTSMAEWAQRCIEQGGLVVMPHAPNPQAERAADIVLDLVHAMEMMTFNPHEFQISPYGLYDWYRYLNLGYLLPVVGGSDKMSAASLLGGIRTYAHIDSGDFTYQSWMNAVRRGNTFVSVGPLVDFTVNGTTPGNRIDIPNSGGTLDIVWQVESLRIPIHKVELIAGGRVVEDIEVGGKRSSHGSASFRVASSTWLALRVRGGHYGRTTEVIAHSSVVQVIAGGRPVFSGTDATDVLRQIEGTMAYVDTLATRGDVDRYHRVRANLQSAHNRLHERMHRLGFGHSHQPLHPVEDPREH